MIHYQVITFYEMFILQKIATWLELIQHRYLPSVNRISDKHSSSEQQIYKCQFILYITTIFYILYIQSISPRS